MDNLKVLIVDDCDTFREKIRVCLLNESNMTVVGECANGVEALDMVKRARIDVVLLDAIMPRMDGFMFLKKLNELELSKKPTVIMITALIREDFVRQALSLGVSYYMVKPIDTELLKERIKELHSNKEAPVPLQVTPSSLTVNEQLSKLFLELGIPAHIKGFHFLRAAVQLVIKDTEYINGITKILYPKVAKDFETTASKVERAIRHAIEVAWSRGRLDVLNKAFSCRVAFKEQKPTNGEFIALLADSLKSKKSSAL